MALLMAGGWARRESSFILKIVTEKFAFHYKNEYLCTN